MCEKVGKTLIVTTSDERTIKEALKINRRPPVVLNVVHGMFVVYEGNIQVCSMFFKILKNNTLYYYVESNELVDFIILHIFLQNMNSIINWVNVDARFNIKIAGESQLEQIIKREDIVIVLFTDESNQALNHLLKRVLNELEDSFGIATVEVSDLKGKISITFSFTPHLL